MKILCYTDPHFCEKASIITRHGVDFTLRLENQIQSINWLENLAKEKHCDAIVCLGDFFDHAHLTDQELTALREINWSPGIEHFFVVGNHESEENDLQYSSTMALASHNRHIISKPELLVFDVDGELVEFAFLPYVLESNKQPLIEYFKPLSDNLRLLFSHNDILGLQLGPVVTRSGFSVEELEANCHLCINGHLHNGQKISNKVMNLGNLTGKDFSEDAFRYEHKVMLLDTQTFEINFIENPFAFNFYKLDINNLADIEQLHNLKTNAVLSIKCKEALIDDLRNALPTLTGVIDHRIIITKDNVEDSTGQLDISDLCVDQYVKFAECCRAKLENSELLEFELAEILK